MNMLCRILCAVFVCLAAGGVAGGQSDPFTLPASEEGLPGEGQLRRYDGYVKGWHDRRLAWSKRTAEDRGKAVFLGDSITAGWGDDFTKRFPGLRGANRGIGGDTTRGMLIRLAADVLALDPAAIVILAGTNDIEVGIEPEAAARNLGRIIEQVKAHDAARGGRPTPLVLCRVLPSSESKKRPAATIRRLNELLDGLVRGDAQVTLVDTWALFAEPSGDAPAPFFPDLLHLNAAGYDRFAKALVPVLATLGFVETEPDAFVPEEGFTSLFNGRDLTGWGFRPTPPRKAPANPKPDAPVFVEVPQAESFAGKTVSSDGRYAAIGGRLVVKTPPEGRRIQQLWTTEEFPDDFILKLEFRATPNADSGVFIRQPQLQCRDYSVAGPWKTLAKYRPQEWNELVVTVADGVAKATCNGEPIPEEMKVPATGPIGLEGDRGQMEYRRIRLKKQPKQAAAQPRDTPPPQAASASRRPNVILFIADDVSWDDFGCYGNTVARTPRIDRLAAAGRRFDAAILTASSCSPSRSSIITGRYPHNCGRACELHEPIAAHIPWFPRLLKDAGYHTALVGKNHMSSEKPADGGPRQPPAFDVVRSGGRRDKPGAASAAAGAAAETPNSGGHADWVETLRERPTDRPFFCWFAAVDAHREWDGDRQWDADRYGPRHDPERGAVPPFLVDDAATRADLASHRNEVTRFDHFVGMVVDELERQGILDDTLLLVMADNGRPFPRAKTRLHDSGMRTPLVVHWPRGMGRPGTPTASLVSAVDIAPTILAAAGVAAPETFQGTSFLPVLADPATTVRSVAFSEHNWHDYEAHGRSVRTSDGWLYIRNRRPATPWQGPADSVRSPSHRALLAARSAGKLTPAQADVFLAPRQEEELYFTPSDPDQLANLAGDSGRADVLARLRGLLDRWTEDTRDSAPADLSRDEHDRESGAVLPAIKAAPASFRGTPPGMDRDAAHANAPGPRREAPRRRILVCGGRTAIVEVAAGDEPGRVEWTWPGATREGWALPDGNVLLALSKGPAAPGGAAVEIARGADGAADRAVWRYDGTQAEVNSIQKTAEGTYVLTEAGPNPRLLEIAADGRVVVEFPLVCQKPNAHMQSRMARKQTDGSYLVPHLLDFAIVRYGRDGKEISRIDTRVAGEPALNSWPFTAIMLPDGGILAGLTNGNRVVEFGPDGRQRWQVTAADTGGAINDACGVQRLPGGTTMIASYRIGKGGVRLLEVGKDGKIVWEWKADVPGVHHFHVFEIDGRRVPDPALR